MFVFYGGIRLSGVARARPKSGQFFEICVGRPRREWIPEMIQQSIMLFGGFPEVLKLSTDTFTWSKLVKLKLHSDSI